MKISPLNLLSLYLTGQQTNSSNVFSGLTSQCPYSGEELSEMEMTKEEWIESNTNSFKFKDSTLNLNADWDTFQGYMRNTSLGMFDCMFSGFGSSLAKKMSFANGIILAGLSLGTSFLSEIKKLPVFSTNFSFFNFGGRLIRAPLHIFDSTFSLIGEKGAKFALPSILAGAFSLFSLNRVLNKNENKNIKLPNSTIAGTIGRTAVHHFESMLASKATEISNDNPSAGSFLASSLAAGGLMTSDTTKNLKLSYRSFEGLTSLGGFHFLDSLFSNIGNTMTGILNTPARLLFGSIGLLTAMPLVGSASKIKNQNASYSKLGGRLIRSIFHIPETLVFNLGNLVGKGILGIPISAGFIGITSLLSSSKSKIANLKIPVGTIGGQLQRLPFDFIYPIISNTGTSLSKLIPAPLLVLLGPIISFKLGEKFKTVDAKYTELKGLFVRNSCHLWEAILSNAAFRTGKLISGDKTDNDDNSGTMLADGRWLSNNGQIIPTMAIGKQLNDHPEKNLLKVLFSALGGIALGAGGVLFAKTLQARNNAKNICVQTSNISPLPSVEKVLDSEKGRLKELCQLKQ